MREQPTGRDVTWHLRVRHRRSRRTAAAPARRACVPRRGNRRRRHRARSPARARRRCGIPVLPKHEARVERIVERERGERNRSERENKIVNENNNNSILNSNIPSSNDDDPKSNSTVEQDGDLILFKSLDSCKICNLMIIVKSNKTSFYIKFFKKHLITTEIVKISADSDTITTKETNKNNSVLLTE